MGPKKSFGSCLATMIGLRLYATRCILQHASPDGKDLSLASADGIMRLGYADTGQALVIAPFGAEAMLVAFSPEGRALACGVQQYVLHFDPHAYDEDVEKWLREAGVNASGVSPPTEADLSRE